MTLHTYITMPHDCMVAALDKARVHPVYAHYKVRETSITPITNAFGDVFVKIGFCTKSESAKKNIDIFDCLGFSDFENCTIECANIKLEN